MRKILLVGDDGSQTSASDGTGACISRTKKFYNELIQSGFTVVVCSPQVGRVGVAEVKSMLRMHKFDCIVAISPFPVESVVNAKPDIPLWIDINGMHSAELQLKDNLDGRYGERMLRMLSLENSLLVSGDAFSAPSKRQSYAICGELLLLGRKIGGSEKGVVVTSIPHCLNQVSNFRHTPSEQATIISTGSFNLWFDEEVLFKAFEFALSMHSTLKVIVTGGVTPSSPQKYDNFCKMVESSSYKDRYSLLGWVSREKLLEVYSAASMGVYTDIPSAETMLGARTRVLDWISRGIPVVCTAGAEISEEIQKYSLGLVVPQKNHKKLAEAFLAIVSDAELVNRIKLSQKKWSEEVNSSSIVFQPLVEWCSNPCFASKKMLGSKTVQKLNGIKYYRLLFVNLSKNKGVIYAIKRALNTIKHLFV